MCFLGVAVPAQLPGITFEGRQNVLNTGLTKKSVNITSNYVLSGLFNCSYNNILTAISVRGLKGIDTGKEAILGTIPADARPTGVRYQEISTNNIHVRVYVDEAGTVVARNYTSVDLANLDIYFLFLK